LTGAGTVTTAGQAQAPRCWRALWSVRFVQASCPRAVTRRTYLSSYRRTRICNGKGLSRWQRGGARPVKRVEGPFRTSL
jgi:hypothetical protein